ncbi:uncharacterized protein F4807DRAFT_465915 [Annulohypoxylon truncatum]|uniref:uncharacterized protein n=1 Tax=Annulohypoxylon truncatum TaxID=327061 RepID=UPI0020081A3D|nr:uncharacterized protein F4807DRAFT_465915 [Annulohypoxylon truncatum]KAI1204188.1 hypothetical protein F4807DRAFT_465915 [Annulohypoxylon truncatum]
MSGYIPYGPGSCYAQSPADSSAQNTGSTFDKAEATRRQRAIGHRRQRSELIGYKFPDHKSEHSLERETEKGSRQRLLKNAGLDDGPYPWFSRPVPRTDQWAKSNVDHWDPYHPEYAGNDENRELPSVELPPAVSPISSFQLLGMTGEVAPSQDSQETASSQGLNTRTSSFVNLPIFEPTPVTKSRALVTFHNGRFRIRRCFAFRLSRKKVTRIIYSSMGVMVVNIIISAVVYNTTTLEGTMKIAVLSWLGGSILVLLVLLIYNSARCSRLQESGDNPGYNKDWAELGDIVDALPPPSRVRLHDNGLVYRAHAAGQLPSLTNVSSVYPNPPKAASKSKSMFAWLYKSKSKASANATESDQAIRCGCAVSGQPGRPGPSIESQGSIRSTSMQYGEADGIGIARSDSLRREEEMANTMKDRHRMQQQQQGAPSAETSAAASSASQRVPTSVPNFSFPLPRRPSREPEREYGSGLPPRDRWCKEPCGSMSNLRDDHYGNEDPGASPEDSSEVASGGKMPKRVCSLAARFNELTPITERSGETLTPRSLLLSSPLEAIHSSSPPPAHIPYTGSNFF